MPDIRSDALAVSAGVLALVWLMPERWGRVVPAPLVALVLGTLAVKYFLPDVSVLGDIPSGLPAPHIGGFEAALLPGMIGWALILALLGSIGSLLTSLIADSVTRSNHKSNRELVGQGIGNVDSGLFGGIPGATVRTIVNVRTGGRTPLSGMFHAMVLLAIVLGFGPLASFIPHMVLAGILMKVGIDIIDWGYLERVPRAPRAGVVIMLVVLVLTVFVDLIIAFATGMVAASLLFVNRMSDYLRMTSVRAARNGEAGEDGGMNLSAAEQALPDNCADQIILYHFAGPVSFGAAKGMARKLVLDESHHIQVLDFADLLLVDTSGAFAIDDILARAQSLGASVHMAGMSAGAHDVLERLGVFELIDADHIHATRLAALTAATPDP